MRRVDGHTALNAIMAGQWRVGQDLQWTVAARVAMIGAVRVAVRWPRGSHNVGKGAMRVAATMEQTASCKGETKWHEGFSHTFYFHLATFSSHLATF